VTQAEIRWSKYRKVPILVCEDADDKTVLQVNDSSLIVSLLASFLQDRTQSVGKLLTFYPAIESKNSRGKTIYEYPNKYFIMYGETGQITDDRKDERHWRQWTDDVLVHTLSPNIYRTPAEALQAFRHFSDAGEWSTRFGYLERLFIIYVGATAMFFVGRILKKRHKLNDDVRESMYDACRQWTAAVHSSGGKFLGGDRPDLADLAVYGVLSAVDGCNAFDDLVSHTDIARWYQAVKKVVSANAGLAQTASDPLTLPV
jgi:microsomal prostaglandin-E synthase 2